VRLAEVYGDGTVRPLDVVENYRLDVAQWGRRTANANALYLLRVLTDLEEPPDTTLKEARRKAQEQDPLRWRSVVVALPDPVSDGPPTPVRVSARDFRQGGTR
jgi:hypothetical protein